MSEQETARNILPWGMDDGLTDGFVTGLAFGLWDLLRAVMGEGRDRKIGRKGPWGGGGG